jgi:hypothetical protein
MPVQSGVEQSASDQPVAHVQAALPVLVAQLPWPLQPMPPQSAIEQSDPDQPLAQVHSALPVPVAQLP